MADPAIPVIDIGPYRTGDPAGTKRVVEAVGAACERIGFLLITGHGTPDALVRQVFDVSLAFFDLPLEQKLALRSDDPGIPRGYSALASKSLGRTYGLDTPPDLREQFFVGPLDDWAAHFRSFPGTPVSAARWGGWRTPWCRAGSPGRPDAVASVYGAIYADRFDPEAAVHGLGEEFLLPRGFIKVHACGRYIHGALDCVETLMARHPLPPESIRAIRVRTYAMAASLGHTDIRSEFGARFSLPFAVASLLCHRRSGLDNYAATAVADSRIQDLARRVAVVEDPDFTCAFPVRQPTEVTMVLADGTEMSERADFHRGEAEHPHPPGAVRRKFLDLTAPVWGHRRAEDLYGRVLDLERVPDVAALAP